MSKPYSYPFLIFLLLLAHLSLAQKTTLWSDVKEVKSDSWEIRAKKHRTVKVKLTELNSFINGRNAFTLLLPLPDDRNFSFNFKDNELIPRSLKLKYPSLISFSGYTSDKRYFATIDCGENGFHALIRGEGSSVFIDPVSRNNDSLYISYFQADLIKASDKPSPACGNIEKAETLLKSKFKLLKKESVGPELKIYRMAVTCTGEYAQFHGGTTEGALSAIITTVNRVSSIYQTEVGIKFELVPKTDELIFLDGASDPYSNTSTASFLSQVQTQIDNIIGTDNYDIGHGLSTNSGGLAILGSVCTDEKAKGVSGSSFPVGDAFDIDFVAHEIGHQFGAAHTFNGILGSCAGNHNAPTAFEPGSGSTIMAYAGICGSDNIVLQSDAYFHGGSYDQIVKFVKDESGSVCGSTIATNNLPPNVSAVEGGFYIPANTPFELEAAGIDPDGDPITYCWEETDLGPQGEATNPSGNAPIFRSFPPTSDPKRIFPNINDLIDNSTTKGEMLPTYSRDLSFRVTARDLNDSGGVNFDTLSFFVSDLAGPFKVSFPSSTDTFRVNESVEISWDPASTMLAPISCEFVDVLISTDSGKTFPLTVLSNTPNDGIQTVDIPNTVSENCRIKIKASNNIFFDISDENFSIIEPTDPDFTVSSNKNSASVCGPDSISLTLIFKAFAGYDEEITIDLIDEPANLNFTVSETLFKAPDTISLSLSNTENVTTGSYNFNIESKSSSGLIRNIPFQLSVFSGGKPSEITLIAPENLASDISITPKFSWEEVIDVSNYEFQIDTDSNFSSPIIYNNGGLEELRLTENLFVSTDYFWRVRGQNTCGNGEFSPISTFTTTEESCSTYISEDVPVAIPNENPFSISNINVSKGGMLTKVELLNLKGTHEWISDIEVRLQSPTGTLIKLFGDVCNGEPGQNFSLSLSDTAENLVPCAPAGGTFYKPDESFRAFGNEPAAGTWELIIDDEFRTWDDGVLNDWSLKVCVATNSTSSFPVLDKNEVISLENKNTELITSDKINWIDPDNQSSELTYTVIEEPKFGSTLKGSDTLKILDTFTQLDIDSDVISYSTKLEDASDTLVYQISDGTNILFNQEIIFSIISSAEKFAKSKLEIFPNPVEGILNIRHDSEKDLKFRIYNSMGLEILSGVGTQIDLNETAQGPYIIFIYDDNDTVLGSTKIIKK
jgi:subtilisin-like proprotein convertase family protein